jgi:hypothetical protein
MLSPKKIIQRQVVTMNVINLDVKPLFCAPNHNNSCIRKMLKYIITHNTFMKYIARKDMSVFYNSC